MTSPLVHHTPVASERVLALLAPALTEPGAVLVDATVGLGGHSRMALDRFPAIRIIGIDRDPEALEIAAEPTTPPPITTRSGMTSPYGGFLMGRSARG